MHDAPPPLQHPWNPRNPQHDTTTTTRRRRRRPTRVRWRRRRRRRRWRSLARARARAVAVAMSVAIAAYDAGAFDDARAMSHSHVGFVMMRERNSCWPTDLTRAFTKEQKPSFLFSASVPWGLFKSVLCFFCVVLGKPGSGSCGYFHAEMKGTRRTAKSDRSKPATPPALFPCTEITRPARTPWQGGCAGPQRAS